MRQFGGNASRRVGAKGSAGEQNQPSMFTELVSGAVGEQKRPPALADRAADGADEQYRPFVLTDGARGGACEQIRPPALTDRAAGRVEGCAKGEGGAGGIRLSAKAEREGKRGPAAG